MKGSNQNTTWDPTNYDRGKSEKKKIRRIFYLAGKTEKKQKKKLTREGLWGGGEANKTQPVECRL